MTIKVKQKSEDLITIRCNSEQEIRFVLGLFADLKQNGRMGNRIRVRDRYGDDISIKVDVPVTQEKQVEEQT